MAMVDVPLPYKYVIFKDDHNSNWDKASAKSFDLADDPFHNSQTDEKKVNIDSRLILREFCSNALDAVLDFLKCINHSATECPAGYAWYIKSVQIARTPNGLLSCKEFSVIFAVVKKETRFRIAVGDMEDEVLFLGTPDTLRPTLVLDELKDLKTVASSSKK
jgi:hypothetical protein